jgi:hypothetical protein
MLLGGLRAAMFLELEESGTALDGETHFSGTCLSLSRLRPLILDPSPLDQGKMIHHQ